MSRNETVRAWKDARFAATLPEAPANPAGPRLAEVGEEQLQNAAGGYMEGRWWGRVYSASYECWGFVCG